MNKAYKKDRFISDDRRKEIVDLTNELFEDGQQQGVVQKVMIFDFLDTPLFSL